MKFGTPVLVLRGGHTGQGPGCFRKVKGILIGMRRIGSWTECWVRLTEDDPYDCVGWNRAGDVGRWSYSQLEELV